MGTNTGSKHRKGAAKNRTQTYNQKTGCYVKRDTKTGRFISCKKETPFKGVSKDTKAKVASNAKKN
jgi:hypothetical protein